MTTSSAKFTELVKKLREIFQIDKPELDFGIYRILNARAGEINDYLQNRLYDKVQAALVNGNSSTQEQTARELREKEEQYKADGMNPDSVPRVQELRQKLAAYGSGTAEHQDSVFSHLLTFFSRYYDNGDFISQRRYKGDTYAIPYAGEEVMLHWANKDQYYTKSGENFSNYSFKLEDGKDGGKGNQRIVHFRLVAADTAKDNRKDNDKERRFALIERKTVIRLDDEGDEFEEKLMPVESINQTIIENGKEITQATELILRFEYKAMAKGSKQDALTELAVKTILADATVKTSWLDLAQRAPTEKNPQRTLLEKHLTDYTGKNSADYFIHKDLGGFLKRELDFYIKSEVMHLDDVQNAEKFADIEKSLRMIQCLRAIALEVIAFLAQIENFQKKLWLKKKFVVSADYCITLDRVPKDLYSDIVANERQWAHWKLLGLWDCNVPGEVEDLTAAQYWMVDTALFDTSFRANLLKEIPDLDASLNGLLVHGDNFQALTLLKEKYREKVKCIYIDPPYNTGSDFLYKDAFRNSSWLSMLDNRIQTSRDLASSDAVFYVHIDDKDEDNRTSHRLMNMLEDRFGAKNYLDNLVWVKNTTHNDAKAFSHNHEYILAFAKDREVSAASHKMFRMAKPGFEEVQSLIARLNQSHPSLEEVQSAIRSLYTEQTAKFKEECRVLGLPWNEEIQRLDPWKGIKQYKFADYRDSDFVWVDPNEAKTRKARLCVYREDNPSWPNANTLTAAHKDPLTAEYRLYNPLHPITGQPCPAPARGWLWRKTPNPDRPNTLSFDKLVERHLIHFGADEDKIPQFKRFLENVDSDVVKSVITDFTDGEKEVSHLFGSRGNFPNPKPTPVAHRLIEISATSGELVLDYFAGSGSTGHSVLKVNRSLGTDIRYMLIDVGDHFETILHPRIQKVVYSADWKDGKPTAPETGISHAFKVLKLESYEDTLNNLELRRTTEQGDLLASLPAKDRDDYLLHYMLDVESRGSLLSVETFKKPFDASLKVAVDSAGATKLRKIDLVETFNYLIGLTVKHMELATDRGYARIEGTLPSGESALILWRDCELIGYEELMRYTNRFDLNSREKTYDVIYVNGDHNIPAAFTETDADGGSTRTLKLRQIEPEFLSRMFSVEDV
jgi:adenine-specific DNA-methyltransferase